MKLISGGTFLIILVGGFLFNLFFPLQQFKEGRGGGNPFEKFFISLLNPVTLIKWGIFSGIVWLVLKFFIH